MSDRLLSDADLGLDKPNLLSDADLGIGARPAPKLTSGEQQALSDEAKVKAAEGVVPESVKAGTYSALNTALFNAPSHAVALKTYLSGNRPYGEVYKEQKEYEDALARRSPIASKVGMGAGFVGGLAVPLGPVAKAGQAAKAVVAPRAGELAGRAAEASTMGGVLSGAGSYVESGGPFAAEEGAGAKALRDAAVGAGAGAVLGPAIGGIASRLAKKPDVTDAAGELSPAAARAVEEAFGKRLSPEDIQRIRPQLEEVMGQKGISVAAAKEALLKAEGIDPTKSMVTGKKPPVSAAEAAEEGAITAREKIAETGQAMAGPRPPESAVARALLETESDYHKMGKAQYDKTFSHPGYFADDFKDLVLPSVVNELNARGIPTNYDRWAQFTYAPQAMRILNEVSAGNMPLNQPINMRNLNEVSKGLNALWAKASGEDRLAIQAMKKGFANSIQTALKQNLFYGGTIDDEARIALEKAFGRRLSSPEGEKVLADMQKANDIWSIYRQTFYGKDAPGQVFREVFKKFKEPDGSLTSFVDPAAAESAQAIINANLLKGNMGAQVYQKLETALGRGSPGMEAVDRYIKNYAFDFQNNLANLPKKIDSFLAPENLSLAKKVFTPAEISQMRRLSEATKIINARKIPDEEKESLFVAGIKRVAPAVVAGIAGAFHGVPSAILAALGAESVNAGARGLARSLQIRAEQAGAPVVRPEVTIPAPVRNVPGLYPVEEESGYGLPPDRVGRADGGKVMGAEGHADRLVAMAEKAKHNLGKETKPLLNAPDEHIAKALEIANRHI